MGLVDREEAALPAPPAEGMEGPKPQMKGIRIFFGSCLSVQGRRTKLWLISTMSDAHMATGRQGEY